MEPGVHNIKTFYKDLATLILTKGINSLKMIAIDLENRKIVGKIGKVESNHILFMDIIMP